MRILIIGGGSAGRQLAGKLCAENHDVVLVDADQAVLNEVEAQYDILTLCGNGSSPETLKEAELAKVDLLIAVTNQDEVNILAGLYAHAAGVRHKVVRVTQRAYIEGSGCFDLRKLGIDLVVSQKSEAAREFFNVLSLPGTQEVVNLLDGKAMAVGLKVHFDSPLIRGPLKDMPIPELLGGIRFIAVVRGDEVLVPHGETQFMIGDSVYFLGSPRSVRAMLDHADPEHTHFEKIVVCGGGELGLSLAQLLEQGACRVTLVEQNAERAQQCARQLDRSLVIRGDALSGETLQSVNIDDASAFVAVMGDDENNIVSCLLAEKEGASFTLARISNASYVPIIDSSSLLDRAISPSTAMMNAILRFIRGRNVQSASLLHNLPGELLEVELEPNNRWTGQTVRDVRLPKGAIIAASLRRDELLSATGDLKLMPGDRLVVYADPKSVNKVGDVFRK